MQEKNMNEKSAAALREEAVLEFWQKENIFQKSVERNAGNDEFVFYEGPPTANAKPALHHLEARAFKDVIPRYKTMQGFHVRRRAGWDTHGLPVELQIEKKLGLKSKKEIEQYGIAQFNKECKDSVFEYIGEWEKFTDRIGYWVDKKSAYYTFDTNYVESLWNVFAHVDKRGLLYKDYKVVPWCPRCGTGLSSHELAQGYADVKDLSVIAKFKVVGNENTYFLAWTTTPWTLPGNVALAVGEKIDYVKVKVTNNSGVENYILAWDLVNKIFGLELINSDGVFGRTLSGSPKPGAEKTLYEVSGRYFGKELSGTEYEPLYPYLSELDKGDDKLQNAYKVYAADFVNTEDGTGIVHTAVMYGQDDFELGSKVGLPKFHLVDESGHFIKGTGSLEGMPAKDREDNGLKTSVEVLKYLQEHGNFFAKEQYTHSYPHCWRCKTPLIYYARDSWYIKMSALRDDLVAENEKINWEPSHIKEGRFGEWIREVKDWAISRERYWGTPMPVWQNADGERIVVDSFETLKKYTKKSGNNYIVMRHGESEHNLQGLISDKQDAVNDHLTDHGKSQVQEAAELLKNKKIDLIVASPFIRTKETTDIVRGVLGLPEESVSTDARLHEMRVGTFSGTTWKEYHDKFPKTADNFSAVLPGGESYSDVRKRVSELLYELEQKYSNKNILIVTHGGPAWLMVVGAHGYSAEQALDMIRGKKDFHYIENAVFYDVPFVPLPHNENYELDPHRPYIDEVVLEKDGKEFRRVKEVMDVWFDSGSMPFAQDHYPFENKDTFQPKSGLLKKSHGYPADFISEAIDQTRGWFYTLLAVGTLMECGTPFKNAICLGHLLDKDGKKMSKSIGNIVEPFFQIEKFGVDTLRLWMYSVNQPGDSKNYDEKTVMELHRQVFGLLYNVLAFYELYRDPSLETSNYNLETSNVLDQWILARLNQLVALTTESLDGYKLMEPVRALRDFIDDLSTWYLRRSRDRIKEGDADAKQTLYFVLKTVAQIMAPAAPFAAEDIWLKLRAESDTESVHLSSWPKGGKVEKELITQMSNVRDFASMGLKERQKAGIPVRQPLQKVTVPNIKLETYFKDVLKDELNVKEVVESDSLKDQVLLDPEMTPELKKEGDFRELVRAIQDLRKQKGLMPSDSINIKLPDSYKELAATFGDELKKTVTAKNISVEAGVAEISIEK